MKKIVFILCFFLISSFVFAKVNINTASVDELMTLKGIGKVRAEAIVKYRKKHGAFKSISDLQNVNGIGENIVKSIKSDVTLSGKTTVVTKKKTESKKKTNSKSKVNSLEKAKSKSKQKTQKKKSKNTSEKK